MEIVDALIGAAAVILAAVIAVIAKRRRPIREKRLSEFEAQREVAVAITKVSTILDKNYAGKILDDIGQWDSQGMSKTEILNHTLGGLKKIIGLLEGLQTGMDNPEYEKLEFTRAASVEIKAAAESSKDRFVEILTNAHRQREHEGSDAEILAAVRKSLMRMTHPAG